MTARLLVAAAVLTLPALHRCCAAGTARSSGRAAASPATACWRSRGAQLCYFNAVARLSVGVALLLEYLGILLVVGWLWLRHGHRPRRLTVAGAAPRWSGWPWCWT